jgi:hypothetical protein
MMSVRVRDVSIPVSKVDLRPDPAGITSLSDPELTTMTWDTAVSCVTCPAYDPTRIWTYCGM